jgi:hypothetical protein
MARTWRRAIKKYGSLGAISFEKAFSFQQNIHDGPMKSLQFLNFPHAHHELVAAVAAVVQFAINTKRKKYGGKFKICKDFFGPSHRGYSAENLLYYLTKIPIQQGESIHTYIHTYIYGGLNVLFLEKC